MGFFVRKSFGKGPFRTTISKRGISVSVGGKGGRVGYYASTKSRNKQKNSSKREKLYPKTESGQEKLTKNTVFSRFNLSSKEMALFSFIFYNEHNLGESFTMHDVSCLGHISSNTCYNNLYNKGLLLKPSRGRFALNMPLLERLAKELQKRNEQLVQEELRQMLRSWRRWAWFWGICSIPMILIGVLIALVDSAGIVAIAIGIIEAICSRHYFKKYNMNGDAEYA